MMDRMELPRADHSDIWDKRSRVFPLCVTHNRYLTHPLSYILKYEMGRYVKKWLHGVLDTLQNEIRCVADRCERWQCLQRNTRGYGTSVVCRY